MTRQIRSAVRRSHDTLIADMLGALSLVVMLFVGLNLPAIF